jgi:hypothetical protein
VEALFERMEKKPFVASMDEVLGELEPEDFVTSLEDFVQLIAGHYSRYVEITITAPYDGDDDGDGDADGDADEAVDTSSDYESGEGCDLACE